MSDFGLNVLLWLQDSGHFNWDEAAFVLMLTMLVMGGMAMIEWVRTAPKSKASAESKRVAVAHGGANGSIRDIDWFWAIAAGVFGTAVMTAIDYIAGLNGVPQLFVPANLAIAMGANMEGYGWAAHLAIGILLAFGYAMFFANSLLQSGSPLFRGAIYGLLPFLAAQLIVIPLMGGGVFNAQAGDAASALVLSSLFQHVIYGATVGFIYAMSDREPGSDSGTAI